MATATNKRKLLEGLRGKLGGEGIELNVRNLANFTAENGVLCSIRCGRRRGRVSLPPKLLGIRPEKWKESDREFYDSHISMGTLAIIPKEYEAKLNQLEMRARRLVQENSVNGSYVPLAAYGELRDEFETVRKDYLSTIDEVSDQWEVLKASFIKGLRETVAARGRRTMLKADRERLVNSIIAAIPTAGQYRSNGYLRMEVRAFPVTGVTTEGLAPDLEDALNQTWSDDVVSNAIRGIETSIGQVFAQACAAAKGFAERGKFNGKTLNTLVRVSARVKKMNVFANPLLDRLGNRLVRIEGKNDETVEEAVEEAILDIYEYALATRVHLDMDVCPFTAAQLNAMLSLRKADEAVSA